MSFAKLSCTEILELLVIATLSKRPKTTMRAMCSAVLMTPALHAVQKPFAGIAHTRFFHRACTISSKRFFHMPSHVGQQASFTRR
ncbi:hypothetical protein, partial [Pseudomonas viridiflava]|uniref:hypothetical protein n=2 Tax=Pseudomonas viridiflava TaxID=33069 RepID=UPI0019812166